jgi:hypothetical protein
MQMRHSPYRSVLHCAKSVYHAEGLHAFYVSYPPTLTMTVPFTAVQFSVYESLKSLINPEGGYSPITHVVAGGVAGGVAAAVTTPLDVAKVSDNGPGSAELQTSRRVLFYLLHLAQGTAGLEVADTSMQATLRQTADAARHSCRPAATQPTPGYATPEAWPRLYESSPLATGSGVCAGGCCPVC